MDQEAVEGALAGLPLGTIRFFRRIGSTNDEAARWANEGAPDLALVIADEQTAGRGRSGRKWFTPPGSALAFSLVLRDLQAVVSPNTSANASQSLVSRLTALGALAVSQTLGTEYRLTTLIKWPNDVLLERRKVAGILTEAHWQGNLLSAIILGIGINIAPTSVPPEKDLAYPATCIEAVLGHPVERLEMLRAVVANLLAWLPRLSEAEFLHAWETHLAFKREWVYLVEGLTTGIAYSRLVQVLGLDATGGLRVRDERGEAFTVYTGEVHLRPLETNQSNSGLPGRK